VPGVSFSETALSKEPGVSLAELKGPETLSKLFDAIDWYLAEARRA